MIPRPLARRLDRLSRRAHAFHRFAHHPLCDEYAGEIVRLGRRTRICRGCTFVAVGTMSGLIAGAVLRPSPALTWAGAMVLILLSGSHLGSGRPAKWRTRLLPAGLLGCVAAAGVRSATLPGIAWAVLAVATFAGVAVAYRRRTPDRTPCTTCPERLGTVPCRGVRPIVRRERAFQRLAGRIIARADLSPVAGLRRR